MLKSKFFGNEYPIKTNTKQANETKNNKQACKKPTKQQQFKDKNYKSIYIYTNEILMGSYVKKKVSTHNNDNYRTLIAYFPTPQGKA